MSRTLYSVSILFLVCIWTVSLCAPLFPGFDPNGINPILLGRPLPPSFAHWFGTDELGRDVFLRCIDGARISLLVSVVSVGLSLIIGLCIGLLSGYGSSLLDHILMRVVDIFMAIPSLFLILTIQVLLEPSIVNVMVVIGLTSWMGLARLVRAEVKAVKQRPFILAAKARGIGSMSLVLKHIFPHCLNPVIVSTMLGMGAAILLESVLSFLGLGVQPPHASWGNMLQNSLEFMVDAPWMSLFPGVLITLTVLALNFIGDELRERLHI